jgi:23S rRNA (adenine2503-C2)-methyltransferase
VTRTGEAGGRDKRSPTRASGRSTPASTPRRPKPGAPDAAAPDAATPQTLLAVYRPDIAQALSAMDAPAYRYAQVYEHLFRRPLRSFSEATTLPTDTRVALDDLGVSTLTTASLRSSPDGATKLLLAGRDGSYIETVIMRYRDRVTACISSQVGCPVGCVFCATGAMGFRRNLSVAEIVDQARLASALVAEEDRRISNLVYMGMGEPLLNLQAVLDSIRILTDPQGMGAAHRALSVSTIGIPSGILRLGRVEPQVNLALSLHAADDRTRALLVPGSFRHTLSEILGAAWEQFAITHRKLLVEYVLLDGVNDSADDARRLAALLRGHVVTVNLLAWNPVSQLGERSSGSALRPKVGKALPSSFRPSAPAAIASFRNALVSAHIEAVIRQSKGGSIQAACGQLAGRRQ